MTYHIKFEVSLHSLGIWPTVCRSLLDWLAQSYIESCVLTKNLYLIMFSISISCTAECDVCAYEATDDFTIIFSTFSKLFKVCLFFHFSRKKLKKHSLKLILKRKWKSIHVSKIKKRMILSV